MTMRGSDERSGSLFSYVDLETRVRSEHPLRVIRELANAALAVLSKQFGKLYTKFGRPSIAPEKLLRAMLLQVFYGVRSERRLMERMEFDLLFRVRGRSGKSDLAKAMRYTLGRWAALNRYVDDGRVEIDKNAAECSSAASP
jgi:transposase